MLKTVLLFVVASIFEVSGCYLIWQFVRSDKGLLYGLLGAFLLVGYGWLASQHTVGFSKVFVVYGVVFMLTSMGWAMMFEGYELEKSDWLGGVIILIGAVVIYVSP
ncbi:YnfA family protein [Reichenbachiella ulvae]|uniref:YnfA family protein n=1 Tax=Reichenbachiella ulvae TaxID=2980104 RepID=A0ABT3D1P4_9BACT|nr:YnfA family protein [Reichenbachiella ulvae]MCV9389368.1 YnfA family protein [Reichenbachiella ulvae]